MTEKRSRRQEKLPQEIRDLLKFGFGCSNGEISSQGFPPTVFELKLDNPLHYVLEGDGGFHTHGLSDSLCYIHHYEDEDWAVIFPDDCDGDYDRGEKYYHELKKQYAPEDNSIPD